MLVVCLQLSGGKSCVNQVAENESEDTADLVVSYGSFEVTKSLHANLFGCISSLIKYPTDP